MKHLTLSLLLVFSPGLFPALAGAHGGAHEKPLQEKTALPDLPEEPPLGEPETSSGPVEYQMEPAEDQLETEVITEDPLWGDTEQPGDKGSPMDLSDMAGHDEQQMAQMKKVELAKHEWISSSNKGYGWAVALTLFSGALFGFLTFKRPFE
ncbi:MAG: hypothetical protein GWM98_19570 [Nitrospinaceae bacterium]|nr:hypothetical protein [Nitrospinaceae bacterium]NIR56279.1 hypothetical protein [Nitrospinaceae bacterium]NIS86736.1 hypothetical protein [Nitrospinaceae bacterium]NIT83568.1 hypothetical protein [Nitrospinaceae bacterium]NIU45773.1 hypothetical protein [Nitrospinaceae bacterium]